MAEFRLTPAAERDLEGIWDYTQEQWGDEQADRYLDKRVSLLSQGGTHRR
jgi:toxin ParE1/3/4